MLYYKSEEITHRIRKKDGKIKAFQYISKFNDEVPLSKEEALNCIRILTEYIADEHVDMNHDVASELTYLKNGNLSKSYGLQTYQLIIEKYGDKLQYLNADIWNQWKILEDYIKKIELYKNDSALLEFYFHLRTRNTAIELEYNYKDRSVLTNDRDNGYVYVIQEMLNHTFKIGKSKNPHNRFASFTKMPFDIKRVFEIKTNNRSELEHWFHTHFEEKRMNGEWFELSEADLQFIATGEFKRHIFPAAYYFEYNKEKLLEAKKERGII